MIFLKHGLAALLSTVAALADHDGRAGTPTSGWDLPPSKQTYPLLTNSPRHCRATPTPWPAARPLPVLIRRVRGRRNEVHGLATTDRWCLHRSTWSAACT